MNGDFMKPMFINDEGIRLVSLNPKPPDLFFDNNHNMEVVRKFIL